MMTDPTPTDETELEMIDGLLADIGTLQRRANHDLTEGEFLTLVNRSRRRLRNLRSARLDDDAPVELTDAGAVVAAAGRVAQSPQLQQLIRRIPELMTAQKLADHPSIKRARFYGPFAAIDGVRT